MKIFERNQPSLFGGVLDWMFIALALLWPLSLGLTWLIAQGIAAKPYDQNLQKEVLVWMQWLDRQANRPSALSLSQEWPLSLPASALKESLGDDAPEFDRLTQVVLTTSEQAWGVADFPLPVRTVEEFNFGKPEIHVRDEQWQGQRYRVAYAWINLESNPEVVLVQVAENIESRHSLTHDIIMSVMLPQLVVLPLIVFLLWLALAKGLGPLQRLEEQIRQRRHDDLSPLEVQTLPVEVAPLAASINDLLARLKASIETKKKFLADAAHQLKTPLAGLRMQAELAQREHVSEQELKHSLVQLGRSSQRAANTVNQLLSLARAESGAQHLPQEICDMGWLIKEVMQEALPLAIRKHIDLGYEELVRDARVTRIMGNATLLKEMVRNLLDNAMLHTPSSPKKPGIVTLSLRQEPLSKGLVFQIEDSGPGIHPQERELVFQPFYRLADSEIEGSGLGLSIVKEIALQHGATVRLEDVAKIQDGLARERFNAGHVGLRVKVSFGAKHT